MLYNVFKTQVLTCGDQCVFRVFIATGNSDRVYQTLKDTKNAVLGHLEHFPRQGIFDDLLIIG